MTIEIEYFDDIGKLQADPRAAPALSQARTPFDRPEWWSLLQKHCQMVPMIALASDGKNALVWPLAKSAWGITSLANFYNFDTGPVGSCSARLLKAVADDLRSHTDRLELGPMHISEHISRALARSGWIVQISSTRVKHHFWDEGRNYEQYLAERPGRLRTTLKRKAKKVETQILHAVSNDAFDYYRDIYRSSWKPEETSFGFWREFCDYEGEAGRLRFGLALRESEPVAAQIWTVENGVAYIHKLAHRPEAEPYSPGTVLTAALMRHVLDQDNVEMVDFGIGDEPYKRDWMEMQWTAMTLTAVRPDKPRNWPAIMRMIVKPIYLRLVRRHEPRYAPLAARESATMATSRSANTANMAVAGNAAGSPGDDPVDAKLREVLVDILALDPARVATFDAQTGLFGHVPELDSQAVATLLTEVEDRFAIVIDDEDVDGEMLETYGGLRAFVRAKCAAAA